MRHEADIPLAVLLEGKAGVQLERFAAEGGLDLHQVGLAVVEHLRKVAGLFKVVSLHAPSVLQFLPVDFALVDGLVAPFALRLLRAFLLFFLLFHVFLFLRFLFLCLLCRHLFLHLLLITGGVHLVRGE